MLKPSYLHLYLFAHSHGVLICCIAFSTLTYLLLCSRVLLFISYGNCIAILSTIVHITMCYCNVNTISNMLHLLTPSPLPCHAMLYRILMTLYFHTCMIINVKDLFLTPPALNMNMNYYLYCITYCKYG